MILYLIKTSHNLFVVLFLSINVHAHKAFFVLILRSFTQAKSSVFPVSYQHRNSCRDEILSFLYFWLTFSKVFRNGVQVRHYTIQRMVSWASYLKNEFDSVCDIVEIVAQLFNLTLPSIRTKHSSYILFFKSYFSSILDSSNMIPLFTVFLCLLSIVSCTPSFPRKYLNYDEFATFSRFGGLTKGLVFRTTVVEHFSP